MQRVSLFHVTPLERLGAILSADGLRCARSAPPLASAEHLRRRERRPAPAPLPGDLLDYVGLYFARQPPQLYAQPKERPPNSWIYLITTLERVRLHNPQLIITDGDPHYDALTRLWGPGAPLDELDWPLLLSRAATLPEDPDATRRRAASVLVYKHLPLKAFQGIATADSDLERRVRDLMRPHGLTLRTLVRPEWFEPPA